MSEIDIYRDALYGNPPSPTWEPSREGSLAAFTALFNRVLGIALGVRSYATVVSLPASIDDAPVGSPARVYADPIEANNTYWIRLASSGANNGWAIDQDYIDQLAAVVQPSVDDALAAAGFNLRSDALAFASRMGTGETTEVYGEAANATRAAVAGEYKLDGTAATVGDQIPLNGRYTKQASGSPELLRTGSLDNQLAAVQAAVATGATAVLSATLTTESAPVSVGPSPLKSGGATAENRTHHVGQATTAGALYDLYAWVSALGDGTAKIIVASGTLPDLTFVAAYPFTVAQLRAARFTAADFGAITIEAGQHILIETPAGGATFTFFSSAGSTFYYCPPWSSGSVTMSTAANSLLSAYFRVTSTKNVYASSAVPAADRTDLRVADDMATSVISTYGIDVDRPLLGTATMASFSGGLALLDTVKTGGPLQSVSAKFQAVGTGAVSLVIAAESEGSNYIKQWLDLPAITATGNKTWTAADFTGLADLDAGDMVLLYVPSGGAVLAQGTDTSVSRHTVSLASPFTLSNSGYLVRGSFTVAETRARVAVAQMPAALQPPLTAMAVPTIREWVMFAIAGQSNAVFVSTDGLSEVIPAGQAKQYYASALTEVRQDPIGNANTKSAWPMFANTFTALTGLGVIFVPVAVVASGLYGTGTGGGTWNATGTLRGTAVAQIQAAQAAADAAGLAWRMGGILWSNGESDGDQAVTQAQHFGALGTLLDYFEAQLGYSANCLPFIMARTGTRFPDDAPYQAQYKAIRDAQDQFARSRPNVAMGFVGAVNFVTRGLTQADFYHYNKIERDEMGYALARIAARVACA